MKNRRKKITFACAAAQHGETAANMKSGRRKNGAIERNGGKRRKAIAEAEGKTLASIGDWLSPAK